MPKFTTQKIKDLLVNQYLKEQDAVFQLMDRHDGFLPSGYYKPEHWSRYKKVKLKSVDEQHDKLGFEPLDDFVFLDFRKEYQPITFPCTCRIFVCALNSDQYKSYEEDDPNIPDNVTLAFVTDEADENVLLIAFTCD